MTFTHALSTNNYGPAKFIVSSSAANGTHTTIASSLAVASSGDTIFIRNGTYTENLTLVAGVNICAFDCDADTPNVIIVGKMTMTTAGTVTISGCSLRTNSDFIVSITGSAASIVILKNCFLDMLNNTGLNQASSSGSALIRVLRCRGDLGTTGIKIFDASSNGGINFIHSTISNTGASVTGSTTSTQVIVFEFTRISSPLATTSTGSYLAYHSTFLSGGNNATSITTAGTGTSIFNTCYLSGGTASATSAGAGTTIELMDCIVNSSNAAACAGAGTTETCNVTMSGTNSEISSTTKTFEYNQIGKWRAQGQPCFLAYANSSNAVSNVTGDGTAYTMVFSAEVFDQGGNFDGTSTFTAPVTGKYLFTYTILSQGNLATHTPTSYLVAGGVTYILGNFGGSFAGNYVLQDSVIVPLTAGQTAVVQIATGGGTKTVDLYGADGDPRTKFSGMLVA